MSDTPHDAIARQIKQVRRRLWLRTFLHGTLAGWSATFLAAGIGFVVHAGWWGPVAESVGWFVMGGALLLGCIAGLVWAWLRAPSSVTAALALDEQFELKERVTTFCSLRAEELASPAGQALLDDVRTKVAGLDVRGRFPVKVRWSQLMVPGCTLILAACAWLFAPQLDFLNFSRRVAQNDFVVDPKEIKVQLDNLKKVHFEKDTTTPSSKEMKEIEDAFDKLLKKDLDAKNEDQVRETIQAMRDLQEKMKERITDLKNLKEKNRDLKSTLDQLDKLSKKTNQEGPAKDFQDALAKGNLKKAMEEIEKLKKKLDNKELTRQDLDKLAQQFHDLKEQLERLHDQKEERDQLQKDFDEGKIDQEQLQRELDRLNQEKADMEDLQDLADLLEECKECMGKGGGKGLSGKLERLRGKLQRLDIDEEELRRLMQEQDRLEEARLAILGACQGRCQGKMNGLGQGERPGGKRPVGEEPKSKVRDDRQRAEADPQGKMRVTGFTKGGVFSKIPAKDVGGAFQRADQESSAVLDRQRIPADAADISKGYFKKLGGQ